MDVSRWDTYIKGITRAAESRRHAIILTANPPATEAELEICDAFARIALPDSYKRFLKQWNGVDLKVVPASEKRQYRGIESYSLELFGTTQALYNTYEFREWFRDLENYNIEHYTQLEAIKYYKFGTFGPSDWHLLFDLSRTDPTTNESPVIYVHVYDEEWTMIPPTPIAANFDEFLDRCLSFMIETEGGFMYFEEPDLSGWEP